MSAMALERRLLTYALVSEEETRSAVSARRASMTWGAPSGRLGQNDDSSHRLLIWHRRQRHGAP